MPKDNAWRVSAFGSWFHPQWRLVVFVCLFAFLFLTPLGTVTLEMMQELGLSWHSSAFDAGLTAETCWSSANSLTSSYC